MKSNATSSQKKKNISPIRWILHATQLLSFGRKHLKIIIATRCKEHRLKTFLRKGMTSKNLNLLVYRDKYRDKVHKFLMVAMNILLHLGTF